MGATLLPCPDCARHIRRIEAACPFCGAPVPVGFGESARLVVAEPVLSRAAILFATATTVAGCGGITATQAQDASGDVPNDSANSMDSGGSADGSQSPDVSPGPLPAYGPAPVDAGTDASTDGFPVLYGPAPVDSGNG
jgi:hypothetical protein